MCRAYKIVEQITTVLVKGKGRKNFTCSVYVNAPFIEVGITKILIAVNIIRSTLQSLSEHTI